MSETYRSHGKLLLTGEYAVLDGAEALGLPTRPGQTLQISGGVGRDLYWKSLDQDGNTWFETTYTRAELQAGKTGTQGNEIRHTLLRILREAAALNPFFLEKMEGTFALSTLEFPRNWGLGSSSTLISNIAQWAGADPYSLLWNAFSGSGYDIACAMAQGPLVYSVQNRIPKIEPIAFNPPFRDKLFFVHLNRKQNSREAISHYKKNVANQRGFMEQVSGITRSVVGCTDWDHFCSLLLEHEELLSDALQLQRIQDQLFFDFDGVVKSLGAWGGDFVLATGTGDVEGYFRNRGFGTILTYDQLIL